jgi:hypothetical protein
MKGIRHLWPWGALILILLVVWLSMENDKQNQLSDAWDSRSAEDQAQVCLGVRMFGLNSTVAIMMEEKPDDLDYTIEDIEELLNEKCR